MFKKLTTVAFAIIGLSASVAYAEGSPGNIYVDRIYTHLDGNIFVYFKEGGLPGCYANVGAYLGAPNPDFLATANPKKEVSSEVYTNARQKAFSLLMAAQRANSAVSVNYIVDESKSTSSWSRCRITSVQSY